MAEARWSCGLMAPQIFEESLIVMKRYRRLVNDDMESHIHVESGYQASSNVQGSVLTS